jgi:hypothetical protein
MNPDPIKYPFGFSWEEMDIPAFQNMRDWLTKAVEAAGAQTYAGGIGFGAADIAVIIEGAPFEITIRPLPVSQSKDDPTFHTTQPGNVVHGPFGGDK